MRIKTISLWEPWATLMALGLKRYETRHWRAKYRGLLAIHAAKRWRDDQVMMLRREPYASLLGAAGYSPVQAAFPLGCVVAVVELVDVEPTEKAAKHIGEVEYQLGNYRPGRFAWETANLRKLAEPVPATGAQGLWWWDCPPTLVRKLGLTVL